MNIAEMKPGELIMRHKSIFALKRESDEIWIWFCGEYEKFKRVDELCKAFLSNDSEALAKAASSELEIAGKDVANLKAKYGEREASASLYMASTERLAAIMREYVKRNEANKDAERRSRRLNESWNTSPPGGQWLSPALH